MRLGRIWNFSRDGRGRRFFGSHPPSAEVARLVAPTFWGTVALHAGPGRLPALPLFVVQGPCDGTEGRIEWPSTMT